MRKTLVPLLLAICLMVPAAAFAASDPTAAQYHHDPVAKQVRTVTSGPSLPYTGADLFALAAVAVTLTGFGVVLSRLAKTR